MRRFFGLFCLVIVMVAAGCDSDETITGEIPIADIDGLRVELPCIGTGTADVNCATPDADEGSTTIDGEDGTTYNVTIRLRGLVEQKTYTDYTNPDGMWVEGGAPDGGSFNIFRLHVSSPEIIYYLNVGSSYIDECFVLDIEKTIVMDHGATLTLLADAGGDALSTKNRDDNGDPIVVNGVPPYPYPFDGQFVQMDIVDVTINH